MQTMQHGIPARCRRQHSHRLCFERDPIPYALETDWLVGAAGFEPLHFEIRSAAVDHGLRLSLGMKCGTTTSIEMRKFECSRPERRVFANSDSEMQWFEFSRLSQPVRSSPVLAGGPPKSAQIGPIRRIRLSLRVPDRATGASFRFSVSEGHFWCLVFGRCGCSVQ